MAQKVKFQTPFGVARYPHISSPDTKGKYADNKFKVKLVFKSNDPAALKLVEQVEEAAKAIHGAKGLKMYLPVVVDEDAGEIIFTAKTNYAPAIFDGRGQPVKGKVVGGGSVLRLAGQIVEFEKGISAQFNQVQIKELNGFGECAFESIEDGYEYDGSEDAVSTFGSNDTSTNDNEDTGQTDGSSSALDI